MSLDIAEALQQGFSRAFKKNGLMIMGLLFIVGFLNTVLSHSINASLDTANAATALALPIPLSVSIVLGLLGMAASIVVGMVAIRTFVGDRTDHIPEEYFKRNILRTSVNLIAAGLVVGIAALLALLVPAIPGLVLLFSGVQTAGLALAALGLLVGLIAALYLVVRLILTNIYVAAEDQGFIDALKDSWNTTEGQILPLLGLVIIIFAITLAIGIVLGIPSLIGIEPIGTVLSQIGSAVGGALTTAILAQVYLQFRGKQETGDIEVK